MARANRFQLFLFLILLTGFGVGLVHLFALRFQGGDIYPPYCSYRADPLGTQALYESLDRLEEVSCSRNLKPLKGLDRGEGKTLWILGVNPRDLLYEEVNALRALEGFMSTGGRLVVSLLPLQGEKPSLLRDRPEEKPNEKKNEDEKDNMGVEDPEKDTDDEKTNDEDLKEEERRRKLRRLMRRAYDVKPSSVSLRERWGFSYQTGSIEDLGPAPEQGTEVHLQSPETRLHPMLSWHSTLTFTDLKDDWRAIYSREDQPVLIERPFGKGTLVLMGDSFLLSNQAMRDERRPDLISWLVGQAKQILFEETYHGIMERPNMATLARRYGLQGVEAGLLVLACLFLWHQLSPFLPKLDDEARLLQKRTAQGRDQASGLVHLLKRSIPASQLISICFQEWKKSLPQGNSSIQEDVKRVERLVQEAMARSSKERDPISTYRKIATALKERK